MKNSTYRMKLSTSLLPVMVAQPGAVCRECKYIKWTSELSA